MICIKGKSYTPSEWRVLARALGYAADDVTTADCDDCCRSCKKRRVCLDIYEAMEYACHMAKETSDGTRN